MEKKKTAIGAVANAGKNAVSFLGKAKASIVKVIDQNDDGSFDMKDVSAIAETIGQAAQKTASAIKENVELRNVEQERKALQPIFLEDLESPDFVLSKLVRVAAIDKKHAESAVCQGSIGYFLDQKELHIVSIFSECIGAFGLTFYPDADSEMYYVDPTDRNRYIALDDYFNYMKVSRVNELQKIAQDLGARHFKVTYKEFQEQTTQNTAKIKENIKACGGMVSGDTEHSQALSSLSSMEVAAEMQCLGHSPVEPKLTYLQREPCIQSLIALRMDKKSPMLHQKYLIKLSNSSGMKEKDAVKIDAALKALKINGGATVLSEARRESRRIFEYEIDF